MKSVRVLALALAATVGGGIAGAAVVGAPATVSADPAGTPPADPYPPASEAATAELEGRTPISAEATPVKREALFFPITPCRVVDSRLAGGRIGANQSKSYYVGGAFGFEAQGGKAGGCGIPTNATAVAVSVVAYQPTIGGYLTAWPTGSTRPLASTLNFVANRNTNTGATFTIRAGDAQHLSIYNNVGTTHVILDVTGYYAPQMQAQIITNVQQNPVIQNGSSRVLSVARPNVGYYAVTWDTDVTRCSAQVTTFGFGSYASQPQLVGSTAYVYLWTLGAGGVPVLTNGNFRMTVTC